MLTVNIFLNIMTINKASFSHTIYISPVYIGTCCFVNFFVMKNFNFILFYPNKRLLRLKKNKNIVKIIGISYCIKKRALKKIFLQTKIQSICEVNPMYLCNGNMSVTHP